MFPPHVYIQKNFCEDWASFTGGQARGMGVHAMLLATRSEGSRQGASFSRFPKYLYHHPRPFPGLTKLRC